MNKNQWLAKLHELAFEDTRLDKIPFVCFEPLAEGIANIQAVEQTLAPDVLCTCGATPVVGSTNVCMFCGLPKAARR